MSHIDFEIKGMGEIIKNNQLKVPIYQRPYTWGKNHIEVLFNDIQNAMDDEEYFIGTIVLLKRKNEEALEIVDGQQRLATIVIFFSAIKNYYQKIGNEQYSSDYERDYLCKLDRRTGDKIPKLKLGYQDNDFYESFIVNDNKNKKVIKDSHSRIKTALSVAEKQVQRISDNGSINDWVEFIEKKLKAVVIISPSHSNAFMLFETLNDRGLELAQIDLIKNYLLSRVNADNIDDIHSNWIEMTAKIEDAQDEKLILQYIRHYWSSQYGLTREKNRELFNDIRTKTNTPSRAADLVISFKNEVEVYLAILNHKHSLWVSMNNKAKDYVETLNYLSLEQYRPLLFSILRKFPKENSEIKKTLKLMVSWLVRNMIIGSLGGGALEKIYSEVAKEVYDENIINAKELKQRLLNQIPSDKEFRDKFLNVSLTKQKLARYYLIAMENYRRGETSPELIVNSDPSSVNLEHILPQSPDNNWNQFPNDTAQSLYKRVGNLTLLGSKTNSELKNAPFDKKKEVYKES